MMNIDSVKRAYRRYARIYDILFGPVFHPGRRRIIDAMACREGDRILEVGVGTGLSLPLYPENVRVTGIDVSAEMLDQARRRLAGKPLPQVTAIEEMDAERMTFPDGSFDKVVAMYVVSVAPDPQQLVREMRRVCKPGGDIFIANHFRSSNPFLGGLEQLLAPISRFAGFRPDFDLEGFLEGADLELVNVRRVNAFGYWKVLHCRNHAVAAEPAAEDVEPAMAK